MVMLRLIQMALLGLVLSSLLSSAYFPVLAQEATEQSNTEKPTIGQLLQQRLQNWRDPNKIVRPEVVRDRASGDAVQDAGRGLFRETVAIVNPSDTPSGKDLICSGVLIDDRAVLTAAHCVCTHSLDRESKDVVFGQTISSGVKAQTVPSKTRFLDPKPGFCERYQNDPLRAMQGFDLALLFLDLTDKEKQPGEYSSGLGYYFRIPHRGYGKDGSFINYEVEGKGKGTEPYLVAPAKVAGSILDLPIAIRHLVAVGFGVNNFPGATIGGDQIGWKLYVPIEIKSKICGSAAARRRFSCAAGLETVLISGSGDTCVGDSGGPLFAIVNQREYYLIGITSRAIDGSKCGPGGVYSLITPSVVRWLERNEVVVRSRPFAFHQGGRELQASKK